MTKLTERRKADRETMAAAIVKLAQEYGFAATMEPLTSHEIDVELKLPQGLSLTINLDGKSPQPDVHVLPWHVSGGYRHTRLADAFSIPGWEVNPHHRQKLTAVVYGFEGLLRHLRRQFELVKSGQAFAATGPRVRVRWA